MIFALIIRMKPKLYYKNNFAFTLIELLIVVAIIGIIASISIPNLLRAKIAANEASAIANLRGLFSAQQSYRSTHTPRQYGHAEALFDENYIDRGIAGSLIDSDVLTGYNYALGLLSSNNRYVHFDAEAGPFKYNETGKRQFYMNTMGTIYTRDEEEEGLPEEINSFHSFDPGDTWNIISE